MSDTERARYRFMAELARTDEVAEGRPPASARAPGLPIAVLRLLADAVGPGGRADGVDQDAAAVAAAAEEVDGSDHTTVRGTGAFDLRSLS